jgi:hypothetical protein
MAMQTLLTLSAGQTMFATEGSAHVIMPLGPDQLVETAFGQGRPHAAQLETAINLVEDALMATGLRAMPRGALVADARLLHLALGVIDAPVCLTLAQVERRYQDIAHAAQRLPSAPVLDLAPLPLAVLILVRECMHHLGYSELVLVKDQTHAEPACAPQRQ